MTMPPPPKSSTPPLPTKSSGEQLAANGVLTANEYGFILDSCLKPKHRKDPSVLAFIDAFIRCKHIGQASEEVGIKASIGYQYRHRMDIANVIQKLIDKSAIKYGFDASEIIERTKEMVDFDPIMMVNADGSYKDNLNDIAPEARRNLKKLKVHNLYNQIEDINGMKSKIIIGKVIEYEFYDKLKAIELVGKEKELFKTTTRVEHALTKDMASILLESVKRGQQASIGLTPRDIVEVDYTSSNESSDDNQE